MFADLSFSAWCLSNSSSACSEGSPLYFRSLNICRSWYTFYQCVNRDISTSFQLDPYTQPLNSPFSLIHKYNLYADQILTFPLDTHCCNSHIDKGEYRFDHFLSKSILTFETPYMTLYPPHLDIWPFVHNNSLSCCSHFLTRFATASLKGKFFTDMT